MASGLVCGVSVYVNFKPIYTPRLHFLFTLHRSSTLLLPPHPSPKPPSLSPHTFTPHSSPIPCPSPSPLTLTPHHHSCPSPSPLTLTLHHHPCPSPSPLPLTLHHSPFTTHPSPHSENVDTITKLSGSVPTSLRKSVVKPPQKEVPIHLALVIHFIYLVSATIECH